MAARAALCLAWSEIPEDTFSHDKAHLFFQDQLMKKGMVILREAAKRETGTCMYVCVYVCMYVCTCMYVRMYVCMYVHVCMYVCMYMYVCVWCNCVPACVWIFSLHLRCFGRLYECIAGQ